MKTRARLAAALQNRDLLKAIGEYEEYQPVEARPAREIRSVFDCLASHGYNLGPVSKREYPGLAAIFGVPAHKVIRTEKVGSGMYTNLLSEQLKTGFPQLDAYGEARKEVAFQAVDSYYRRIKQDRKRRLEKIAAAGGNIDNVDEADAAARDAVRCLEHAMIVYVHTPPALHLHRPKPTSVSSHSLENWHICPFSLTGLLERKAFTVS